MRRTWLFLPGILGAAALAMVLVMAPSPKQVVQADNGPHVLALNNGVAPDTCPSCHRTHTATQAFLLKSGQTQDEFCFTCHGGTTLTNVKDGVTVPGAGTPVLPLRGGGFENARINTIDGDSFQIGYLDGGERVTSKHRIDQAGTVWGYGPSKASLNLTPDAYGSNSYGRPGFDLICTTCHDPHGNGNYRILRSVPKGIPNGGHDPVALAPAPIILVDQDTKNYTVCNSSLSFAGTPGPARNNCNYFDTWQGGTYISQKWMAEGTYTGSPFVANTPGTGATPPGYRNPTDNAVGASRDISEWCSTCHTRYLREDPFSHETASGDAAFSNGHRTDGHPGTGASCLKCHLSCVTCHVAHGTNARSSGAAADQAYPDGGTTFNGTPVAGTDSNTRILKMDNRGICLKGCHGFSAGTSHSLFNKVAAGSPGFITPVPAPTHGP